MNKKLIFAAAACAALAACSMAATACDKDDGKATEEEWKQACENMATLENFTLRSDIYDLYDGSEFRSYTTFCFTKNAICISSTDKDEEGKENTDSYYYINENGIVYDVYKNNTGWEARLEDPDGISEVRAEVLTYYDGKYRTSPESETLPLKDLYSAFTYKDGTFSARLYIDVEFGEVFEPIDVELKISGGYVTYYAYDIEMVKGEYTNKTSIEFKAENIGNTSFAIDPDAQSALKKYIEEHPQSSN